MALLVSLFVCTYIRMCLCFLTKPRKMKSLNLYILVKICVYLGEIATYFLLYISLVCLICVCCTYDPSSSSLGMCKKCGNLRMIACTKCKGAGLVREGSLFGFSLVDEPDVRSTKCANCQGRGHFCCPDCSKSSVWWSSGHVKSLFQSTSAMTWNICYYG